MRNDFYLNSLKKKERPELEETSRKWVRVDHTFRSFFPRKLLEQIERSFVEIIYQQSEEVIYKNVYI